MKTVKYTKEQPLENLEFLTQERYRELMARIKPSDLPFNWVKEYTSRKFPDKSKDPTEFKKLCFMVSNVRRGKSFHKGLKYGIIKDIIKLYRIYKKQ